VAVRFSPLPSDPHHVHPSLTIDDDPQSQSVLVAYYTQHIDGIIDVDMANSQDSGRSFPINRTARVTRFSMVLPPTNIPVPTPSDPFATSNYDRIAPACYALGVCLSAAESDR
jgi:hypothetical protein